MIINIHFQILNILFFFSTCVTGEMKSLVSAQQLDNSSNYFIAKVTAAIAGSDVNVVEWRTVREQCGRIEVLLTHHKNLGSKKLATALDKRIAGSRTRRHLSGPSAKYDVELKMK